MACNLNEVVVDSGFNVSDMKDGSNYFDPFLLDPDLTNCRVNSHLLKSKDAILVDKSTDISAVSSGIVDITDKLNEDYTFVYNKNSRVRSAVLKDFGLSMANCFNSLASMDDVDLNSVLDESGNSDNTLF